MAQLSPKKKLVETEKKLEEVNYLLDLLGKKRIPALSKSNSADYQFENMLELIENYQSRINYFDEADLRTKTIKDQIRVEDDCYEIYESYVKDDDDKEGFQEYLIPELAKETHFKWLAKCLAKEYSFNYVKLDASQLWMIYWVVNPLVLIGATLNSDEKISIGKDVCNAINYETGGIGGGIRQLGNMASAYSGLLALSFCDEDDTYWKKIPRQEIYKWLLSSKNSDGSFSIHKGGETDTRSVYCALITASILNIMTPELIKGTAEWFQKCQTYEGGFAGNPFSEAHGGYTFCAVAGLCLLGDPKTMLNKYCNLPTLIQWSVHRQGGIEGGFSGRTDKLVDGCYSHWVGGIFPFLEIAITAKKGESTSLFNRNSLSNYILGCCQNLETGGLFDKPGCAPDSYHTNYVLMGLSHCQHGYKFNYEKFEKLSKDTLDAAVDCYEVELIKDRDETIQYNENNIVKPVHPVFGAALGKVETMRAFFKKIDSKK